MSPNISRDFAQVKKVERLEKHFIHRESLLKVVTIMMLIKLALLPGIMERPSGVN